jgi:hypothetical protein
MQPFASQAYPQDLARLVWQRWAETPSPLQDVAGATAQQGALPRPELLERLFSVCYQASLLHEEGRLITFRIMLAAPDIFSAADGPPTGLHRLVFDRARPFDEHELKRLAPAAAFRRALIGVQLDAQGGLEVWGLVHSGPRWLQAVRGGRRVEQAIPAVLMAAVTGPGRVLASKGTRTLAALAGGTLTEVGTDVFQASWLAALFADLQAALRAQQPGSDESSLLDALLDPMFGHHLAQHVLRRIVSTVRGARHGGTLIFLPSAAAEGLVADGRYLTLKYQFRDEEPRRRIFTLMVDIMKELATMRQGSDGQDRRLGWAEYEASRSPRLASLDEALFEVAHLVAMLAEVDGAVVMTNRLEILGFGGEISGTLAEVDFVERSLDLEGTQRATERTDRVGTRHRSAYRLCQLLHDTFTIVVSQDGGVRFVRWHAGSVTYFDQIATGPWEV